MPKTLSKPPYKRPRIAPVAQEFGDAKDVQRVFGIKESLCYFWWRTGRIKGKLLPGTGRSGGKRLFDFASIRRFIASQEEK